MPISTPAPTSVRWCMPRSMRDQITKAGIATASDQRRSRSIAFSRREASTSRRPQKSATAAAVWPDGKLSFTGSVSSRCTSGRSRWTTSDVARYVPDSMQITNSVKAARRQWRKERNRTRSTPTRIGITTPPASVEPTQERSMSVGVRSSATRRLTCSSQEATPPVRRMTLVNRKPAAIVNPTSSAYPQSAAITKTRIGWPAPMTRAKRSAEPF